MYIIIIAKYKNGNALIINQIIPFLRLCLLSRIKIMVFKKDQKTHPQKRINEILLPYR